MTAERAIGLQIASAGDIGGPEFSEVALPPADDLARLKDKIAAARAKVRGNKTYRIPVPNLEDTFVVEYEAIDSKIVTGIAKQVAEVKGTQNDLEVRGLVAHCRGVYLIDDAREQVSAAVGDPGPAPCFDARLAAAFDEQFVTSDLLLQAFYGGDGPIHSVWEALWDLSGFGHGAELAEATRGN